jgi:hypothetical protein
MTRVGLVTGALLLGLTCTANAGEPVQLSATSLDAVTAGAAYAAFGYGGNLGFGLNEASARTDIFGGVQRVQVFENGTSTSTIRLRATSRTNASGTSFGGPSFAAGFAGTYLVADPN